MSWLDGITDEAKTAIMATSDSNGCPHVRWVSPAILSHCPDSIFMVTSPDFPKSHHISANPKVEWMFQSKSLDKIVNVQGTVTLHNDPALCSEVLEAIGPRLRTFWHVNPDRHALVVLETAIDKAVCFLPQKGLKEEVPFREEEDDGKST